MAQRKPPPEDVLSPEGIRTMASSFQQSRILFTALDGGAKGSDEVARILGTDERATDRLMNALHPLGLVNKEGNRFSNTDGTSQFLVRCKLDYVAALMHTVHLWDSWSGLTDAVRGGKAAEAPPVNDRGAK